MSDFKCSKCREIKQRIFVRSGQFIHQKIYRDENGKSWNNNWCPSCTSVHAKLVRQRKKRIERVIEHNKENR